VGVEGGAGRWLGSKGLGRIGVEVAVVAVGEDQGDETGVELAMFESGEEGWALVDEGVV
jgi:hypothetical protein